MRYLPRLLPLLLGAAFTSPVWAGGPAPYEIGTPDLGLASAGWAARAQDAATVATNPAGMTRLDRSQVLVGVQPAYTDIHFDIESLGHLPTLENHESESDDRLETAGFLAAIDDLNQRISAATGLPINLKLALPLAFVGAVLWSIGRKGLMIEMVPGWLFLWLAFDMFVKLHPADR